MGTIVKYDQHYSFSMYINISTDKLTFFYPNFSRRDINVKEHFKIVLGNFDSSICLPRSRIAREEYE